MSQLRGDMPIYSAYPAIPDLHIPRMNPCAARDMVGEICGATPSSQYEKTCGIYAHKESVNVCPVHAAIVATGRGICRMCADNGLITPVYIIRISGPVRLTGKLPASKLLTGNTPALIYPSRAGSATIREGSGRK